MTKLEEAAERCEMATGPDDGTLDRLIFNAIGGSGDPKDPWGGFRSYTVSMDAAMTLVPEGDYYLDLTRSFKGFWVASWYEYEGARNYRAEGATPALALCASALRARIAIADTHPKGQDAVERLGS